MCDGKPEFIRKEFAKDDIYNMWLVRLDKIEQSTISTDTSEMKESLDIGFQLFPLLDSISYNLFGKNSRYYLKKLGYTDAEADMIYSMFRNGQLHNANNYRLVYDDGEISWGTSSSGGSGGFIPYNPGYESEEFPEDNMPAEKAFEYIDFEDGTYHASLQLDRLCAQLKYDLEKRKENHKDETIDFIVGQKIKGKRRKPTSSLSDKK